VAAPILAVAFAGGLSGVLSWAEATKANKKEKQASRPNLKKEELFLNITNRNKGYNYLLYTLVYRQGNV
jgi:hypothetical protein